MESTIILKTDALNALIAAHSLMEEMSRRSQPTAESVQFQRGFSAAVSTIATVFGLELGAVAASLSPASEWRLADENELAILGSQTESVEWPRISNPDGTRQLPRRR